MGAAMALFLSSCLFGPRSLDEAAELADRRQEWREAGIRNYSFTQTLSGCFCPPDATQPMRIRVRDGRVVEVRSVETTSLLNVAEGHTVEQLFDKIQTAIAGEADHMAVDYAPDLGYPRRISVSDNVPDSGSTWTITDFAAEGDRNKEY